MRISVAALILIVAGCAGRGGGRGALPRSVQDDLKRGQLAFGKSHFGEAARAFDRVIHAAPDVASAEVYAVRASIFVIKHRYADGLDWIEGVAEPYHPTAPVLQEQKALCLLGMGRTAEAMALAEHVVSVAPDRWVLHLVVANYYYGTHPAKAIPHYEAYLRTGLSAVTRGDGMTRVKLGFSYLRVRRAREAAAILEEALVHSRGRTAVTKNARKGLCAAYVAGRQPAKAEPLCVEAVQEIRAGRRHDDFAPVANLGRLYLEDLRFTAALALGEEFSRSDPKEKIGWLLVGDAQVRLGDRSAALAAWLVARRLAPNDDAIAARLRRPAP